MRDTKISDNIPCIRCGVCCSSGVCSHGVEDNRGLCTFLIINRCGDTYRTSCKLVLDKKVSLNDIGIGKGCVLRGTPLAYSYYLSEMANKLI